MACQHRVGAASATALLLLATAYLASSAVASDSVSVFGVPGGGAEFVVAPGDSFSIQFDLVNTNDTFMEAEIAVEGLTSSFQPRVYVNGSEGDIANVPPGGTLRCAATVQAPWLAISGSFPGEVSISTDWASWGIPFNVTVEVPAISIALDDQVAIRNGLASLSGRLVNPAQTDALDVLVTLMLDGRLAVQQRYAVVAGGTNVTFKFEWPAGEGATSVLVVAESRNGAEDEVASSYSVEGGSSIDSDLVILTGGILALVFPLVVLTQMGIQRRREKRAMERKERERQLESALLTLKEGER